MSTISDYRDAVVLARRIRGLPAALSPRDALFFALSEPAIAPNQKEQEILWLLDRLAAEPPTVVLEIGTDRGGTLFLWTRVAAAGALLLTLDIQKMVGRLGRMSPFALVRTSFARVGQRVELVDEVDSHDQETVGEVQRMLLGRAVDFLFIDGDHSYDSVRRDFELYQPLVRPGGLIAFHDISSTPTPDTEGTAQFWSELRRSGTTDEIIAGGAPGYGIGLYSKPR